MKIFAATVMLAALFLLYRIAYPKPSATEKGDETPEKMKIGDDEAVGKSRFVRPSGSQTQTTPAVSLNPEKQDEKANIFAPENGKIETIIPFDRLDEIFGEEQTDEDDLDIPPDEDEPDEADSPDADEETEDFRQELEATTEFANGFSIEEMETAAKAIENPTDGNAELLYRVDKTDMFEKLVSGDDGKRQRIAAVIDRHIRSLNPEVEVEVANESSDNEHENFDIADFLT
jgi:hypothetical protein